MLRRRASDRRSTGRDATGGKTGGGHAAAFPSFAKVRSGGRKPQVFVIPTTPCNAAQQNAVFENILCNFIRGGLPRLSSGFSRELQALKQ
jgi:hypothetical protein